MLEREREKEREKERERERERENQAKRVKVTRAEAFVIPDENHHLFCTRCHCPGAKRT